MTNAESYQKLEIALRHLAARKLHVLADALERGDYCAVVRSLRQTLFCSCDCKSDGYLRPCSPSCFQGTDAHYIPFDDAIREALGLSLEDYKKTIFFHEYVGSSADGFDLFELIALLTSLRMGLLKGTNVRSALKDKCAGRELPEWLDIPI